MKISLSVINPPVLMGYGISTNHHVTFKITFKINFHLIPPNSRDFFSMNFNSIYINIDVTKKYKHINKRLIN